MDQSARGQRYVCGALVRISRRRLSVRDGPLVERGRLRRARQALEAPEEDGEEAGEAREEAREDDGQDGARGGARALETEGRPGAGEVPKTPAPGLRRIAS